MTKRDIPEKPRRAKRQSTSRADLAAVMAQSGGITRPIAEKALDDVFNAIVISANEGKSVKLKGFGVFYHHSSPARSGRNPRTGDQVKIASRRSMKFRAAKDLRNLK